MAQRYFPGGEALGKRFKIGPAEAKIPWYTVAGIVGDVHQSLWISIPTRKCISTTSRVASLRHATS
jgi:hypothetical protein